MTTGPAATVTVPAPGRYRIEPGLSTIRFTTRHLFGLAGVRGGFALRSGELTVADPVESSTVQATIDAATFDTGNARRDRDVVSRRYLDAAGYPDITFTAAGLRRDGTTWIVAGTLTAAGQSAPCELTIVDAQETGTGATFRATARVDRYAHRITAMKGMAGRHLDLVITAQATRL